MKSGEEVTPAADDGSSALTSATALLTALDELVRSAVGRIDPETPLSVSFDAR